MMNIENEKIVFTILTILLTIVLTVVSYLIIKKLIKNMLNYQAQKFNIDERKIKTIRVLFVNTLKYILIIIDIMVILSIFGISSTTLLASLGAVGVVIGLSLQDTLKDFFAGVFIIIENQFIIGDIVEIDGFKGEVIGTGLKTTRIKAYTGETAIISNRNIAKVINFNMNESKAIVNIAIDYNENIDEVINILEKMAEKIGTTMEYTTGLIEILGIREFKEPSIIIGVTVSTLPMKHYFVERELNKLIFEELKKKKIKIHSAVKGA